MAAAISSALTCAPALSFAQEGPRAEEEVIVTATRRAESIQDVPLNIAAVSGEVIQEQGISDLAEVSRTVPGLFVVDQGARSANQIIVRGLNANSVGATEALGNSGGGTVATYVGEIPLYLDLKPDDIERIEVLMGPQGTLYGAGTLGGAIRYIPRRPEFNASSVEVRARGYTLSKSDGLGSDVGFTGNLPLNDQLAFRATLNYLDDPGFIDYDYLVREPGVSNPQPTPADVDANLRRHKDQDDEQTLSGRAALRYAPMEGLDVNLTYYYQNQDVGGRSADQHIPYGIDKYVFAMRYPEPSERKNQLLALELTADLGFAELTSATGASRYREHGSRDQTDLLISLAYSYEAFPSFSAFTRERQKDETFTQEFRLVSKTEGRFDWIAGAYYNELKRRAESREFTPLYAEYLSSDRPDALEYIEVGKTRREEMALYGEIKFHITDQWQVTAGGRWYDYDLKTKNAFDTPLFNTVFDGQPADAINLNFRPGGQKDDGTLFKFNTSYDVTDDVMVYATISEGYRIGNSNGLAPCPVNGPQPCAQPDELEYTPDETTNYEIGARTEWLDGRLVLNGSIYYIDWKDPQLIGVTDVGQATITINGKGAETKGFELSFASQLTDRLSLRGSFAYTKAELTADAPGLLAIYNDDGFGAGNRVPVDGQKGDRLPGSPEQQGSLWLTYAMPLTSGFDLGLDYGVAAQGDVLTRTGGRAGADKLGGFAVHYASVALKADAWTVALYAENLFDKYAATGVRSNRSWLKTVTNENGDPVANRSYYRDILRPREVGLRFTYDFEL
ncbi:MAG: TonB-dependent receptor [Steroidobacteraceae bacterium]